MIGHSSLLIEESLQKNLWPLQTTSKWGMALNKAGYTNRHSRGCWAGAVMWRAGVASVRKGSQVSGRGGAFLEGVAWVWKGLRESRRGRLSPVEVRQVRKGSGESGRGQVSQEGLACVRKGSHKSWRDQASPEGVGQVWKGSRMSGRNEKTKTKRNYLF